MKRLLSINRTQVLRAALIIAGIVFIVLGIMQGEQNVVMRKAVRICLECIGIG